MLLNCTPKVGHVSTFGVFFMAKYDERFKLSVVQHYKRGTQGVKVIAQQYGLDHATVRRWVAAYQQHGQKGLRKKFSHYSARFKEAVLLQMQRESLSARQVIALFDIRGGVGVVTDWQCRYHEQGLAGLQPKPRTRRKKMTTSESSKPLVTIPTEQRSREELEEEVLYLRAEVAYLKKLRALLQSKEAAAQKKRK